MLCVWFSKCVPIAAYLPTESLDEPLAVEADEGDVDETVIDRVADPAADVEADASWRELAARVPQFIAGLPPRLAFVARRHYWGSDSAAEIGRALDLDRSTIHRDLNEITRLGRKFFGVTEH